MNYLKHYIQLVRKAKSRNFNNDAAVEKHHIFPISIYGKNDLVVILTIREHYIAHKLLWKAFVRRYGKDSLKTKKMAMAFHMMVYCIGDTSREIAKNSYMYKSARLAARESKLNIGRPDMIGKRYFGASEEKIEVAIEKIRLKKMGSTCANYPKNRKSSPRTGETAIKISETRKKTKDKFIKMSEDDFNAWLQKFDKPRKDGRINPNVTRALKWRHNEN